MIDLIIKTNGSERRLKLPVDEQSVPGIVEKNSVTTVMVVNEPESLRYLTDEEEADFKDWISGQNSDGLGEGFEQREINTDDGLLSVHFWNPGDDYYVDNEEEFHDRMNLGMGGIS